MADPLAAGAGARRAASVLLGLGPEVASEVFQLLGEADVRELARGARDLRRAPNGEQSGALRTFVELMEGPSGEALAGDELLRDFAARALGPERARRAFEPGAVPREPEEVLGPIVHADPEALAMVLAREQPQTVALVLSAIDAERAVAVMEHVPQERRGEIVRRMAVVESVAPELLREVGRALASELQAIVAGGMRKVDGKAAALEILRRTSADRQAEVVAAIEESDPALAADLRTRLFTFEDLSSLGDRDIQQLLKEIDAGRLAVALKGATTELREKVLRNMSSRAAEAVREDLEAMGPVRVALVEAAQAELVAAALELAGTGRITLVSPADKLI
ncbi:flagellar motor switch protein FliG [Vulgatibacter sp.]|uniref:flagellar motor switch protein FliG n=1 Tax=Vulgatibacter sp. TaxID=1971226 RepID=UPI00356AA236